MTPDDMVLTGVGLRYRGRLFPVTLGRGGIACDKREGDGATPAGVLRIVATFYRPDRVPPRLVPRWAVPIRLGDRWCDAPDHPDYNHLVRKPFGKTNERLRRADPLYDIFLVTDWNWPEAVPGRGSAIFIHGWRRPVYATAGCLALGREDLFWIAGRAMPGTRVVIPAGLPQARRPDQV